MTIIKWLQPSYAIVLAILTLLSTLFLTYETFHLTSVQLEKNTQTYFDFRVREAISLIDNRLNTYKQVLFGVRGLFRASDIIERNQFKQYVSSLELEGDYPGIQGVGASLILPSAKKTQHIESFPLFAIFPKGERDIYSSITYIESLDNTKLKSLGYDMLTDPLQQTAMQKSMDTGKPMLSRKIVLSSREDNKQYEGFLMYLPFYYNGTNNDSLKQRRENILGWIYSPYKMVDFMEGLFGEYSDDLDIHIFDNESMQNKALIYDSNPLDPVTYNTLKATQKLVFSDNLWTIVIRPTLSMNSRIKAVSPTLIASTGIIISVLLSLFIWFLASGRQRAIDSAIKINKELLSEQQRLSDIIKGTRAGTWEWNIQTGATTYNEYWAKMIGYKLSELQPTSVETRLKFVHPDDIRKSKELLEKHFSGELNYYEFECRMQHKDGRWIWVLDRGKVKTWTPDGKALLMYGTHQDITTQKLAAQQIEYSAARIHAILNTVTDGIVTIDEFGIIESVNPATEHMFGYSAAELTGHKINMLMPEPYKSERDDYTEHYRITGEAKIIGIGSIVEGQRKDGSVFPLELAVSKMQLGKRLLFTGTLRDVTTQKMAEQAIITSKNLAENANLAKSQFLAIMSHEIRTPMNGVIGMVDVLQQSSLKGFQVEMVNTIRDSAFSLLAIIEDILDFSKIEAGKLEIEHEPMTVAEVVEKACLMLAHLAENKKVELTLFTDPAIPEITLGDANRLRQIVINLTNNAIKFSSRLERLGRVSVQAVMTDSSMLEIRVVDNGIGMEESTLTRLFTPFDQADITTTRRFGGTGLGLTIARNLVQMMDGEITVQSKLNHGSIFSIFLPLQIPSAEDFEQSQSKSRTEINADLLTGLCCLVIGDSEGQSEYLTAYLTAAGAVVERLPNLAAAQKQIVTPKSGLWVWLIDVGHSILSSDELRDLASTQPNRAIRFVIIERGKRRQPRWRDVDLTVTVDGNVLLQKTLLQAVAIAAGLAQLKTERSHEGQKERSFIAPLRSDALAQGRLILIAEDNETNQKVIVQQLALLGFAADITSNGLEALKRWQSKIYAMLLTDLHMPKMDGYELTAAIRAEESDCRRIPIIAITANALKGEAQHCINVGMDDYLSKPVPLESLAAMLEKWMPIAAAPKPVNVSLLTALVGDDPEIINDFLQHFNDSARQISAELTTACANGQAEQAHAAAHKLKSSARAIGAIVLGDLCEKIELAAKDRKLELLTVLQLRFETEMAAVSKYLDTINI